MLSAGERSLVDYEVDVVVAGAGAGGMCAALTARVDGLDVLLVEASPKLGGTTALSGGVVWVPGNPVARSQGVDDDPADVLNYLGSEAGNYLDRDMARTFLDRGPEAISFLMQDIGVVFTSPEFWPDYHGDRPGARTGGRSMRAEAVRVTDQGLLANLRRPLPEMTLFGGMMVGGDDLLHLMKWPRSPRSAVHVAKLVGRYALDRWRHGAATRFTNGAALAAALAKGLRRFNVQTWTEAKLVGLDSTSGRVSAAVIERSGERVTVHVRRGVVLACGGFPRDPALVERLFPPIDATGHRPLAPEGNAGGGIAAACSRGAVLRHELMSPAAWVPVSEVARPDGTTGHFPHFFDRTKPGFIIVDRSGCRFVDEARSYHDVASAMLDGGERRDRSEAFIVCDHRAIRRYGVGVVRPAPFPLRKHIRSGYLTRAPGPRELAAALGIDPDGLTRTLGSYNAGAREGRDPEFDKGWGAYARYVGDPEHGPNPCVAALDTPPLYAVRIVPGSLGTFAGLRIDHKARVLDQGGQVIEGLYAAGNDAASFLGGTYPSAGITLGPALTFGYVAGRSLARCVPA